MTAWVRRRPVVSFLLVMFAWSWGYWGLVWALLGPDEASFVATWPGLWGPLVAGAVVAWAAGDGVRAYFGAVTDVLAARRWYALAIGGAVAIPLVGVFVRAFLSPGVVAVDALTGLVLVFVVAIFAGGSEELGLRGVAHPRLRDRYGTLVAGVGVGVPWAIWHYPLQRLGMGFDGPFPLFVAAVLAISVLFGWLYDRTGGDMLLVVLAHAAFDAPDLLTVTGSVPEETVLLSQVATVAAYWVLVALLIVLPNSTLRPRLS